MDLERAAGIKGEYIRVKRKGSGMLTFGGDQGFFKGENASKEDEKKRAGGCGAIAFGDLLLYLGSRGEEFQIPESIPYINRILEEEEYKGYFNSIYTFLGGIPFKFGISFLKLLIKFNKLARREGWELRAKWGFSAKKLYGRIEEMLGKDIPVILCIPMMLLKKNKADGVWLYSMPGSRREAFTNAHYVMITGMVWEKDVLYYEISSWGKKYYMNGNEYDTFIHTHFMGTILGNILYIR